MSHKWLARLRMYAAALALVVSASLMLTAGASAATFAVKSTAELESAVASANANTEANTIELEGGLVYQPAKTMVFTKTQGTTLTGPAGTIGANGPEAKIEGSNVQPATQGTEKTEKELIIDKSGVPLTIKHVVITTAGTSVKAAIEDSGVLTVEDTTISGNTGNGVVVKSAAGVTNFTNSTISDGLADGVVVKKETSFTNDTIVLNEQTGIGGTAAVNLTNTIVSNNGSTGIKNCEAVAKTSDHSLDNGTSCGLSTTTGSLPSTSPTLGALNNDGGSTPVHSEQVGSPSIDAGDPAKCPATDQRGYARPDEGTVCDIGANEYYSAAPSITVPKEIVTPATSSSGAEVTYTVSATDSGGLVTSLSCAPPSGSTFPIATTKVECTATDGHENSSKASFNVTVNAPACAASPAIGTQPTNLTVTEPAAASFKVVEGTVPANCSAATVQWELSTNSGVSFTPITGATSATYTINPTATTESGHEFRAVLTNAHGTTTSTAATLTVNAPATSPEAAIHQLLQEVSSSTIPHGIRHKLSCLLSKALRSLAGLSGYGPSKCGAALLSSKATKVERHTSGHPGACEDLQQFIDVIEHDQRSRKPKIPAGLAKAWSKAAHDIEASLGCTAHDKSPGHSSRHAHGRRGHHSGGR